MVIRLSGGQVVTFYLSSELSATQERVNLLEAELKESQSELKYYSEEAFKIRP